MRSISRVVACWHRLVEPDFGADHYPLHIFAPVRYPDDRQDALPNQPRGNSADDFLAGIPRSVAPNETLAGFPHRAAMVYRHGWRIPTPPRLPVYD
jgi:hypothetical protein